MAGKRLKWRKSQKIIQYKKEWIFVKFERIVGKVVNLDKLVLETIRIEKIPESKILKTNIKIGKLKLLKVTKIGEKIH